MTKEQKHACENLVKKQFVMNHNRIYTDGIEYGFQVAQTADMLILNPLVKQLVISIKELSQIIYDGDLCKGWVEDDQCVCSICDSLYNSSAALAPFNKGDI